MPEARFPVTVTGGVPVVAAPEEIDITNAGALRAALLEAAARGPGTFAADLSLTRFCDSSALHALVAAHRRARAQDREMLLVIPDPAVLRVFAITGMDQLIPTFATLAGALAQAAGGRSRADAAGQRSHDAAISPVPSRDLARNLGGDLRGSGKGRRVPRSDHDGSGSPGIDAEPWLGAWGTLSSSPERFAPGGLGEDVTG